LTSSTPNHPLATIDNVTLTAHAGFRALEASMTLLRRAIDIASDIVLAGRGSG
jgi:D-3-phosphoglycerate dehydrogenase